MNGVHVPHVAIRVRKTRVDKTVTNYDSLLQTWEDALLLSAYKPTLPFSPEVSSRHSLVLLILLGNFRLSLILPSNYIPVVFTVILPSTVLQKEIRRNLFLTQ